MPADPARPNPDAKPDASLDAGADALAAARAAPAAAPDIRLVAAHPNWAESRVNRRLLQAAQALPRVSVLDLYGRYPDYDIDVAAEQAALAPVRLLVLLHPVHWYAMPALAKLWVDEVLAHGWAYGHAGTALQGKDFWLVASTGGPQDSYRPEGYNRHPFDAFLPPYRQTAQLCGMRFLPPQIVHGAHRIDEATLDLEVQRFAQRLRQYPEGTGLAGGAAPIPAAAPPNP